MRICSLSRATAARGDTQEDGMAKGQVRSNKETRKPKAEKVKPAPAPGGFAPQTKK